MEEIHRQIVNPWFHNQRIPLKPIHLSSNNVYYVPDKIPSLHAHKTCFFLLLITRVWHPSAKLSRLNLKGVRICEDLSELPLAWWIYANLKIPQDSLDPLMIECIITESGCIT